MSALESLSYQAFKNATNETTFSTEGGKHGVPRYDGDPTCLAEYAFRVRLMEAKIAAMDKAEKAKQGPLGLRLMEGLSGSALHVVREIDMEKLASEKGPKELIQLLYKSFQPRRTQEARELLCSSL